MVLFGEGCVCAADVEGDEAMLRRKLALAVLRKTSRVWDSNGRSCWESHPVEEGLAVGEGLTRK